MIVLKLSPKILFLFLSIVMLTNQSIVNGAKLKCEFKSSSGFTGLDGQNVYYCDVKDNGIFTDERMIIDSVEGQHIGQNTNANVNGFILGSILSLKFFPQNLQDVFGDLLVIQIYYTNLQEIRQNDLKFNPNLRQFNLPGNKITSIDADLFKFNSELRYIYLEDNQISHIDPNVFDHLNNLVDLYLSDNKCKNALNGADSRSEVLQLIQRVRDGECISVDAMEKKKEAKEQAKKLKQAANEEYTAKYESCQSNLTSVANEKSTCLKQFKEAQEKARATEKISEEKGKTCEESNAELNKTIKVLREENEQIQSTVQELKAKNENLTKNLADREEKCESAQRKLDENEELNKLKINDLAKNYEIQLLQSKLEMSEKLRESNEKYTNLLHAKLIESGNIIILVN